MNPRCHVASPAQCLQRRRALRLSETCRLQHSSGPPVEPPGRTLPMRRCLWIRDETLLGFEVEVVGVGEDERGCAQRWGGEARRGGCRCKRGKLAFPTSSTPRSRRSAASPSRRRRAPGLGFSRTAPSIPPPPAGPGVADGHGGEEARSRAPAARRRRARNSRPGKEKPASVVSTP